MSEGAIIANQNGVPFMGGADLKGTVDNLRKVNFEASCFIETIPGYHGGVMSFGFGYKKINDKQFQLKKTEEESIIGYFDELMELRH